MIFQHKAWEEFCCKLKRQRLVSIPAKEVSEKTLNYIVLKHDVETNVLKAFEMACIEHKYGHRGSYYVQAYLLNNKHNVYLLKKMQKMGHEISYHYDVMDSNKGDLDKAIIEFENNKTKFEKSSFKIFTVCQHGNPIIERIGYTSNRDFFRSEKVQILYPDIADIMVDFKTKYKTEYTYYSDAGRCFRFIYDPINNDREDTEIKNKEFKNLDDLMADIKKHKNVILSTHPHRWTKSAFEYILRDLLFKIIKNVAKKLLLIPGMKKFMGQYYYLAKKI